MYSKSISCVGKVFRSLVLISVFAFFDASAQLKPFELKDVRLLEGRFKIAEQRDKEYLLALDADRLLAPFLKNAGLPPKAENYGNWENTGLDGHVGGHYISALAMMYAATEDHRIKDRLDYVLSELNRCQLAAGDGFLTGVPNGKKVFEEIRKGQINASSFGLNGGWVPLYNHHKLFAGLRDAYVLTDSELSKTMFLKQSEWFYTTLKDLTAEQIQDMLRSEHGGLNESMLDAYLFSGDKKFLDLAYSLSHQTLLKPLAVGEDKLTGMHANTQIPKVIGFARIGHEDKNNDYLQASKYFWSNVVNERSVVIGGNSVREHFHPKNDFKSMISSEQGPENCNTYNMLRLSKELYFDAPDPKYLDYYERALYNNILSSIHPEKGGFVYFNSMRPNHYRVYSEVQEDFWCCVGSGIENHGKYGEMIYAHDGANIYVNLFIASELNAKEAGIKLTQKTTFPYSESTHFVVNTDSEKSFSLFLRKPEWLESNTTQIKINGKEELISVNSNGFFEIKRSWKNGDEIVYDLPVKVRMERLPDGSDWAAFMAGPIVLAAEYEALASDRFFGDGSRMGHVADGKLMPVYDAPAVIATDGIFESNLSRNNDPVAYTLTGLSNGKNIGLKPYFDIHEKRYQVYWQLSKSKDLKSVVKARKAQEKKVLKLEENTADRITPGEQQPESDHFFKGENSYNGVGVDSYYRATRGTITYELKAEKSVKKLMIRMNDLIADRAMEVYLDDTLLGKVEFGANETNTFREVIFKVPSKSEAQGKYTLKMLAADGKHSPALTDIRLLYK
jgi:DUF1680 family protein